MFSKEYWFRELFLGLKVTASFDRSESYTRIIDGQVRCITPDFKPKDLQVAWNVQFITIFVPALAELAKRGLLAPDAWSCKRAHISLKATIDVPMLGTIIEQNGDGLLEQSHMPVGWPLHIDGAVRRNCAHRDTT